MTAAMALAAMLAASSPGGESFVPFAIPAKANPKSLIVLPPSPPIAPDGPRVVARDGHFFVGGRRVRIWGVNVCFAANFPDHTSAERVAERLAAAGINSVRFHHMDSSNFPRGIWDPRDPTKLSPEALDRLDYFIDQLARRGIHANINLHVSRTHSRVLKLPHADKLPGYDKMVDLFTPELIQAQKAYARDLLTHVNAYRKVRHADDPAVAFVEITNEDSLFMWGADRTLPSLPPYYAKILQAGYVGWLKGRYAGTAGLRAAWGKGAEPLGQDLLTDASFKRLGEAGAEARRWRLEAHGGSAAKAVKTAEGVRIEIDKADSTGWHVQLNQGGLAVKAGRYYTLTFRARAGKPRRIGYNVGQAHPPWKMLGLSGGARLGPKRGAFRAGFVASADDENARVNFQLGGSTVAVELADVQLRPGGREGLRDGESVEAGNVAVFAESETDARTLDRWRFLAETEKAYFDGMYAFIKTDLGCKSLVTGSIVFGPLGLYGQSGMDYIDAHAYWQHPRFPGRPWDPGNWTVEQKAMVDHPDESPLFRLAAQRLAGKPYTVSEYNHPAPNDYQAECVPMIASFAACQDWDGVWLFAYNHRDDWGRQHFSSFFDIMANPAKWGFVPAGTIIFREGAGKVAPQRRVVSLSRSADLLADVVRLHARHGRDLYGLMAGEAGIERDAAYTQRWAVTLSGPGVAPPVRKTRPSPPSGTTTRAGRIVVEDRLVLVVPDYGPAPALTWWAPRKGAHGVFAAWGEGVWVNVGAPSIPSIWNTTDELKAPDLLAITSTALDGRPRGRSKKVLITACGRCENTSMGFSKDRRTVGRQWGAPPVRIQPVTARIEVPEGKWQCVALGPDGRAQSQVPVKWVAEDDSDEQEPLRFQAIDLDPKYETMWYLLTRE